MNPTNNPSCVALIPARSGSKRVPNKNIRRLGGHPLMAYSISAAIESKVFETVILSTDNEEYAEIGKHYGAEVPALRPKQFSGSKSPDIEWIELTLRQLKDQGREFDCVCILRPTSPFRKSETIQRAWSEFLKQKGVDSLRAVELCSQHPGKMWRVEGDIMTPIMPFIKDGVPWHSNQYSALPEVYVQNASLEIIQSQVIEKTRTITGDVVMPFFTKGLEGFDINNPEDWLLAEHYVNKDKTCLPVINKAKPNSCFKY